MMRRIGGRWCGPDGRGLDVTETLIFADVKLLFGLFAIYILILAGIPCRPGDGCCAEENITTKGVSGTTGAQTGTTGHRPDFPQPCSPFFACGSCHGFVVPEQGITVMPDQPTLPARIAIYKGAPLRDFASAVWQPPKTDRA